MTPRRGKFVWRETGVRCLLIPLNLNSVKCMYKAGVQGENQSRKFGMSSHISTIHLGETLHFTRSCAPSGCQVMYTVCIVSLIDVFKRSKLLSVDLLYVFTGS